MFKCFAFQSVDPVIASVVVDQGNLTKNVPGATSRGAEHPAIKVM